MYLTLPYCFQKFFGSATDLTQSRRKQLTEPVLTRSLTAKGIDIPQGVCVPRMLTRYKILRKSHIVQKSYHILIPFGTVFFFVQHLQNHAKIPDDVIANTDCSLSCCNNICTAQSLCLKLFVAAEFIIGTSIFRCVSSFNGVANVN